MIAIVAVDLTAFAFMDEAPRAIDSSLDLVQRARAGDQVAVEALFARYLPRIQRWAHGRLPPSARGPYDTHDLAQEALTKVFLRLQQFEPRHEGAFKGYVWTTLWNCIRDMARKHNNRGVSSPLDSAVEGSEPSPFEEALGGETFERYERALEQLRPEDREAIVARVELGLPYPDVAAALGKPSVAAAHMAVSRALVKLAEAMAHERKH